jgi:mono/diheme cytochrome c family protein
MDGGRVVFRTCTSCHGRQGEGGVGPALNDVLVTFPDCATHIRWVELGSEGWRREVGPTYGAQAKPAAGQMPAFGGLTEPELRQIAYYQRVRFGGAEPDEARRACGLDG